jgi:hypothetical protein
MTVYARHSLGFEEGVEQFGFDVIPADVWQVWEVEEGTRWVRKDSFWVAVGEHDSVELTDEELLFEFGPVTDDEEQVQGCPVCGPTGCAGHTREPSDVLTGGAQ